MNELSPVKCEYVFLFDEDVERSVVRVPGVLGLNFVSRGRRVHQDLQPGWHVHTELAGQLGPVTVAPGLVFLLVLTVPKRQEHKIRI